MLISLHKKNNKDKSLNKKALQEKINRYTLTLGKTESPSQPNSTSIFDSITKSKTHSSHTHSDSDQKHQKPLHATPTPQPNPPQSPLDDVVKSLIERRRALPKQQSLDVPQETQLSPNSLEWENILSGNPKPRPENVKEDHTEKTLVKPKTKSLPTHKTEPKAHSSRTHSTSGITSQKVDPKPISKSHSDIQQRTKDKILFSDENAVNEFQDISKLSLEELKQLKDSPEKFFHLGKLYELGASLSPDKDIVDQCNKEAVAYYQKAADLGDASSQMKMGFFYYRGDFVPQDIPQSLECFKKIADNPILDPQSSIKLEATMMVASIYDINDYLSDPIQSFKYHKQAALGGDSNCQVVLGMKYEHGKGTTQDLEEAFKWYLISANQNNAIANVQLGRCYLNGIGVNKDITRAVEYYTIAANQGNADAQYCLGYLYLDGQGTTKDITKAIEWLIKAAEQDHGGAQYTLGALYESGEKVPQDLVKAIAYYTIAANQGNADAQYKLGVLYTSGETVSQDPTQAIEWLKQAANQGHSATLALLGVYYETGQIVKQDFNTAFTCYQAAAEKGNADAQYCLGYLYLDGQGTTKDITKAIEWLIKAADQNLPEAQYNLGNLYEFGIAVPQNREQAIAYYQQAADQGHAGADRDLKTLQSESQ